MSALTVITSTRPAKVCKHYTLAADGQLVKAAVANIWEGSAQCWDVPDVDAMVRLLQDITQRDNQAIVSGRWHGCTGQAFRIVTEKTLAEMLGKDIGDANLGGVLEHGGELIAARLKRGIDPSAWVLFDADSPPGMPPKWAALSLAQRLELFEAVLPGVSKVERIELRGSSARVHCVDEEPGPVSHAWLQVDDPQAIERMRSYLQVAMVMQDLSFPSPRYSRLERGKVIGDEERTLFDLAVFVVGRLVFCAQPNVEPAGYSVADADIRVVNRGGGKLRISDLKLPNAVDLKAYHRQTGVKLAFTKGKNSLGVTSVGQLTPDTEITARGTTRRLGEWLGGMAHGEKKRCEAPFRASASEAAVIVKNDDGSAIVHDVGIGTTYVMEAVTRQTVAADPLPWREKTARGGMPKPSMHNARLAITALGIECSYDTFHNKLLFGYRGDAERHEVQAIIGVIDDNGIIRLRQVLSDCFGFDLEDKHTRDGVKSLALEHCFDPVRDMLDKAQGEWDGVERLDRMAVDYFNADDTTLNRAMVRKWMIAAVRRVRQPGCKFDTILVLESDEGWNKSTALSILAGDENFSDESILGKHSREVQEQLSEVWIHENADLAGMRKADVDHVKAHASRTTDRARPAYGHFNKNQPRHSVEAGTTNSDEYLQSQTGNRRFWPLAVRKRIDLDMLQRDRLQLWGEAAHYEAAGEDLTLDEALWPTAGEAQEKRRIKDPWEDILADLGDWSGAIHEEDGFEKVSSEYLLTTVLNIPRERLDQFHTMRLSAIMKRMGWGRNNGNKITIGGRQVRGYQRVQIPPEDLPGL